MSTQLNKLSFVVDLLDRVSGPVRGIERTLGSMAKASQAAFAQVGTGAMGVAGAGASLYAFLTPAEEMRQALGEVASLDVAQDTLKGLSSKALQYSIRYGRAAEGFVRSAYDIQSAIGGLQGDDLAVFTNAGNVLATATKSDAGTITNYMGTMYGIFQAQADKMGKGAWVEQLAGQTATAVQMFKTTGSEFSAAFTSLGANATAAGIKAAEQMAVLGKLQATMSGSEAGTKYKSFLSGIGRAQDKLGMSFVDSEGNMLGMVDILGKLKGRFGDTLSVAESDALKDAFGSDEAVSLVKLLMADTTGLATSMEALGEVKGMDKATAMAAHMVSPWQRITQGIKGVSSAIGTALNPALDPLINGLADASATMVAWMEKFPNITRWIGYGVMAVIGMTAVMGLLTMSVGLLKLGMIGLSPVLAAAKLALALFSKQGIIAKGIMWLLNAAVGANPIVLFALLAIGAISALIYWWDDLKAAFMDTAWGQAIMDIIEWVLGGLSSLAKPIGWVVDKLGGMIGFGSSDPSEGAPSSSPSLDASRRSSVAPGGVTQHISNTMASSRNNQRTVGQVIINTDQPMTKSAMDELLFMGA